MAQEINLQRFLDAQAHDYAQALTEMQAGRKRSHWMWYIFPQIQGLGFSDMAHRYAIKDIAEAEAYLNHPVLGRRLVEIATALRGLASSNATAVMGSPDDLKLRSSITLFAQVPGADPVFQQVLDKFLAGRPMDKRCGASAGPSHRGAAAADLIFCRLARLAAAY